jgi:hypothetical protein
VADIEGHSAAAKFGQPGRLSLFALTPESGHPGIVQAYRIALASLSRCDNLCCDGFVNELTRAIDSPTSGVKSLAHSSRRHVVEYAITRLQERQN